MKYSLLYVPALLATVCNGCDALPRAERVERLAPLVVEHIRTEVGGDMSGIQDVQPPLGHIEVYVDRSLTIQPYARTPDSAFGRLVGVFDDFIASEVTFFGFGFPTHEAERQQVLPLAPQSMYAAETYTYANNDYAALFHTFRNDGGTRVIITDGVQSDPDDGARLSAVTGELHRWLTAGGAFAALLYRNGYSGQYYSDLDGPDPLYDCADRPLVVFVMAPSSRAVDDLLARLGPGLRPAHILRLGGNDLAIRVRDETPPDSGKRRGLRVVRDVDTTLVKGFKPIPSAVIVGRAGAKTGGYVPLQFEATLSLREYPWTSLGSEGAVRFVRQLRPELHGWVVDKRKLADLDPRSPSDTARQKAVQPIPVDARTASVDSVALDGDSIRVRFTLPLRRPRTRPHDFAFLVTLRPSEDGAREMVPDTFSVDDDRSPSACGKVLKLRRLLSAIVLRNYVPGRLLLVADWR